MGSLSFKKLEKEIVYLSIKLKEIEQLIVILGATPSAASPLLFCPYYYCLLIYLSIFRILDLFNVFFIYFSFFYSVRFGFAGSPFGTIWEPRCLLFDILGAILACQKHFVEPFWHFGGILGGHFVTTGPPWRTMGTAGWTRRCK